MDSGGLAGLRRHQCRPALIASEPGQRRGFDFPHLQHASDFLHSVIILGLNIGSSACFGVQSLIEFKARPGMAFQQGADVRQDGGDLGFVHGKELTTEDTENTEKNLTGANCGIEGIHGLILRSLRYLLSNGPDNFT